MAKKRKLYIRGSPSSRDDIIRRARVFVNIHKANDIPDGIMLLNRMTISNRNALIEDRRRIDLKIDLCEKNIETIERLLRDIKRGALKAGWEITKE